METLAQSAKNEIKALAEGNIETIQTKASKHQVGMSAALLTCSVSALVTAAVMLPLAHAIGNMQSFNARNGIGSSPRNTVVRYYGSGGDGAGKIDEKVKEEHGVFI